MEIIVILTLSVVMLILLAILLKINKKNITTIKQIGESKELNELTNDLPENEDVCREILKMLNNENVTIKASSEGSQASLYIVANNAILISNTKKSFTRIQTVAHECVHSVQDKALLWFNFIFSNIYLIYFIAITALTLFRVIKTPGIFAIIFVMMSVVMYVVRSLLETDAMIKARYLAKDYLDSRSAVVSSENINKIVQNYDEMNKFGVKFYNYTLLLSYFSKVAIYCIISLIMINV